MSGITCILNNCYVNSSIQIISIIPELREASVKLSAEHSNGKYHFLVHGFPHKFFIALKTSHMYISFDINK